MLEVRRVDSGLCQQVTVDHPATARQSVSDQCIWFVMRFNKMVRLWSLAILTASISFVDGSTVRDGTIGNRSCRPRCISFRFDRSLAPTLCHSHNGVFVRNEDSTAWDLNQTSILACSSCLQNTTCDQQKHGWDADLRIEIIETGYVGSFSTSFELSNDQDRFTFCSIYPCPKDECALPEQMVRSALEQSDGFPSCLPFSNGLH